jgi:t-SNARE complex subunit (syntaxin)
MMNTPPIKDLWVSWAIASKIDLFHNKTLDVMEKNAAKEAKSLGAKQIHYGVKHYSSSAKKNRLPENILTFAWILHYGVYYMETFKELCHSFISG